MILIIAISTIVALSIVAFIILKKRKNNLKAPGKGAFVFLEEKNKKHVFGRQKIESFLKKTEIFPFF